MKKGGVIKEKIKMLRGNHKVLLYWGYKIANLLKQNVLNNGERYDPNIMKKFNINDPDQEERYRLAQTFLSKDDDVLDIACGTGYGTLILMERCHRVMGVDISKKSIRYANKNYRVSNNIEFVQADIFNFNNPADVVVSFETIEHVKGEIKDVVLKLISLARKRLVCSVPYMEPPGSNKHHVHFNINEDTFGFIGSDYQIELLYQSRDGKICRDKRDDVLTLIVVINRKVK